MDEETRLKWKKKITDDQWEIVDEMVKERGLTCRQAYRWVFLLEDPDEATLERFFELEKKAIEKYERLTGKRASLPYKIDLLDE